MVGPILASAPAYAYVAGGNYLTLRINRNYNGINSLILIEKTEFVTSSC